jgi:hypothetical protein
MQRALLTAIGVALGIQLFIILTSFNDLVFAFTGRLGLVPLNAVVSSLFLLYLLLAITVILLTLFLARKTP